MKELFYKYALFPLSLIGGIPFAVGMRILSLFVKYEPFSWQGIPEDAILYSTHTDVYATCWNSQFSHKKGKTFVVGFHGLTPYLWIPYHTLAGVSWEIYSKFRSEKPSEQILKILAKRPHERLFFMTDAGGPYGKVRPSLIKLSLRSGRPLVAFRHQISRYIVIMQHRIPLPGSRLSVHFSPVVPVEELRDCSTPGELLQRRFDELSSG